MLKRAEIPEGMDKESPWYQLSVNFNSILDKCANGKEVNDNLLMKILSDNSQSEIGKKYDFENIKSPDEFRKKLPLTTYDDYFEDIE